MKYAYEALLRLYPESYRSVFAREMASVFEEAASDYKARGFSAYLEFIGAEFSGLVAGAFYASAGEYLARSRRRLNVTFGFCLIAGAAITAFCQGCLYIRGDGVRVHSIQTLIPAASQAPVAVEVPFILAGVCLLFISVLSGAFSWNMRNIRNRAVASRRHVRRTTQRQKP